MPHGPEDEGPRAGAGALMPVRARAVEEMVRHLEGGLSFNNLDFTVKLGELGSRREISRDEYEARYDAAYVRMVDSIDWMRVFLEASARHHALDHDCDGDYGIVCEECVQEALLAPMWQDWRREPRAPRTKEEDYGDQAR